MDIPFARTAGFGQLIFEPHMQALLQQRGRLSFDVVPFGK